jgi:hypothetical protein
MKDMALDNVHNYVSYMNVRSSQSYRSYLLIKQLPSSLLPAFQLPFVLNGFYRSSFRTRVEDLTVLFSLSLTHTDISLFIHATVLQPTDQLRVRRNAKRKQQIKGQNRTSNIS